MRHEKSVKIWPRQSSQSVFECAVFKIRCDRHTSPTTGNEHDFFIIEPTNWVNIIAVTPDREVVLIEQYRYGSGNITLEIPGGMIDDGEDAAAAARRQMWEDTGYVSDRWELLGITEPNPAIQNNRCHTFLAHQAYRQDQQKLDTTEEIEVRLARLAEIPDLIRSQKITHALVITAFYYYQLAQELAR
jgi:ADP-ribose pyrophosphatase